MLYLAEQIIWLLLIAFIAGIAVGWLTAARDGNAG
jgi:hypothetical protein